MFYSKYMYFVFLGLLMMILIKIGPELISTETTPLEVSPENSSPTGFVGGVSKMKESRKILVEETKEASRQ